MWQMMQAGDKLSEEDKATVTKAVEDTISWLDANQLAEVEEFEIPLASISNTTSIWGTPRGAGGIPVRSNLPSRLLSRVNLRSPS